MADTNDGAPAPAPADASEAPSLSINAQYVKDLSFENPNAPHSLTQAANRPQIEVNVDVQARGLASNTFEVDLHITATAKHGEATAFVVELVYAGLFTLRNVPADQLEAVCLIECPRLIFPFARRIVADATRDGGFPPLLLDPIDFFQLYRRNRQAATPSAAAGNGGGTVEI